MAVVLSAGLLASTFANVTPVKAEEVVKKGTVIYGFEEIKDVSKFTAGNQYFFSLTEYDEEGAVAALPEGSAILQFAGTDVKTAINEGTFVTPEMMTPEIIEDIKDDYASYGSYEAYREAEIAEFNDYLASLPSTPEEVYAAFEKMYEEETGETIEINSWDDILEIAPYYGEYYDSVEELIEEEQKYAEERLADLMASLPESEDAYIMMHLNNEIPYLESAYKDSYVQQDQDGYVTVVQRGQGFDSCQFGTIAYMTARTDKTNSENWSVEIEEAGWYYGCSNTGVGYVGPFYAYSYKVGTFTGDDLIITFAEDWVAPETATTVTKNDITLSVVIDGEEIFIPFFELTDASVDPENNDTTITLTVGEIVKEVEVCNIEPGEIEKDVQIEEGAPTVGLEDAVDTLKETVLTEAELKLVESGVNVDIYMTVAGKEVEDLPESDKTALENALDEDDEAVYLDLKLFKQVGNNEPTAITEVPGGKIKVSIEVPEAIKAYAANAKVVRVHGTEVTELDTVYDAATNKLTFETDKFSTYAIVYNEANTNTNPNPDTTPDGGTTPDDGKEDTPEVPKTGDSSMITLYMLIAGFGVVALIKGKKMA